MKWLKKLRLINWHYFGDETMEFGKQTLITGKSGAGKSTVIDAMQVLFVADQRKIRFNPAAHDETKRTMINYLKGKIGNDNRTFLRDGDFTTYITAEFCDDEKKESFVVGVVIDVFRDHSYDEEYFILAEQRLDDLEFVNPSGHLRNREEFRRFYGGGGIRKKVIFERNKSNFQKALLARMGQLHERFFSVFTKALSFKPIEDIRDFVYDYILDKKELQLDLMKQNFEIHERYKQELEELKKRKEKLYDIRKRFQQYDKLRETVKEQDYVIRRLKVIMQQEIQEQYERKLGHIKEKLKILDQDIASAELRQEEARKQAGKAFEIWQSHAAERKRKDLEKNIEELNNERVRLTQEINLVAKRLQQELKLLDGLFHWSGNEMLKWQAGEQEKLAQFRKAVAYALSQMEKKQMLTENKQEIQQVFQEAGRMLGDFYGRVLIAASQTKEQLEANKEKLKELQQIIRDLQNRKRTYPKPVQKLKNLLEQCLSSRSKVWIFCEEMEVNDESWRDAIEGYLNTQRFDLLVEPHVFAEALSVYEREKWTHRLEGIGLVDTEKEKKYLGTAEQNSLAQVISADHPVIRAHLEHLLGKVIKAENEQELRKYRTAVTRTCMVYSNLVARQIPKKNYEVPFIGNQAIVRQLELKQAELVETEKRREELLALKKELDIWKQKLIEKQSQYKRLSENLSFPEKFHFCLQMLASKRAELESLDMREAERLKAEYEEWRKEEKEWSDKRSQLSEAKGRLESEKEDLASKIFLQKNKVREAETSLQQWREEHGPMAEKSALNRWEDTVKQDQSIVRKVGNWENNWKGNQTRCRQEFDKLKELRQQFNFEYSFNGSTDAEDNEAYEKLLYDIEHLNIPDYQKKVEIALKESEEEFKSHFIFKLREAIQMARREFDELDFALKNFPFSDDKYHFEVKESNKYKKYYKALMDPMLELGSFSNIPDNDRTMVLHELFEMLVHGEADELEEFTDYRRYLDFDIIVTTSDSHYRFSQVLKEKSGGETQTPFYIAILASFHHLYRSGKTIRLMVFDEAFNKMDEERIQSMLRLIKQMNLQLIAAVPDEKIQHMAPEMTTTLIVNNVDYQCFVDMIDRWDDEEDEQEAKKEESSFAFTQQKLF